MPTSTRDAVRSRSNEPLHDPHARAVFAVLDDVHEFTHDENSESARRLTELSCLERALGTGEPAAAIFDFDREQPVAHGCRNDDGARLGVTVFGGVSECFADGTLDIVERIAGEAACCRMVNDGMTSGSNRCVGTRKRAPA